ncbi:MAG: VWA domain-containing protein, partial [Bacteroidaceae bacterium]|nr:VWA domain-containing protein [Bacteroidaceae bacterium]
MFQFANSTYFILLLLVLLLVVLEIGMQLVSRRREQRLGDLPLLRRLTPDRSRVRPLLKRTLMLLAATALIFVLARPQVLGGGTSQDKRKGIEVILMMDVSNSMLSTDIQPSRLERAKLLVSTLIDRLDNDKVGLGVFAGEAYPLLPITNDFVSAKMFLDGVGADMVSLQGTNLSAAIELASSSFTQEKGVGKAIVIITDGEDHEEGASQAAKSAAKKGHRVFVL